MSGAPMLRQSVLEDSLEDEKAHRQVAESRLAEVLELHMTDSNYCCEDGFRWPCATRRAATGHIRDPRETPKLDSVYRERDQLVAALSHHYEAHLATHVGDNWEDDWRNVVCIHLPTGQATWHIHDSEMPLFAHLDRHAGHWDGHSADEKYLRLAQAFLPDPDRKEAPG